MYHLQSLDSAPATESWTCRIPNKIPHMGDVLNPYVWLVKLWCHCCCQNKFYFHSPCHFGWAESRYHNVHLFISLSIHLSTKSDPKIYPKRDQKWNIMAKKHPQANHKGHVYLCLCSFYFIVTVIVVFIVAVVILFTQPLTSTNSLSLSLSLDGKCLVKNLKKLKATKILKKTPITTTKVEGGLIWIVLFHWGYMCRWW